MKLNQRENQGPAAALVLAGAVLLASGCGGGESAKPEATHPDSKVTISESFKLFQEQLKRERGMSREEMAQLVTEIEDLQKKTIEVWGQHAALKEAPGARVAEYQYKGGTAAHVWSGLRIRLDGFRRRLKEFTDDQLPMLGPHIADKHRDGTRRYRKAVAELERAKKHQQ